MRAPVHDDDYPALSLRGLVLASILSLGLWGFLVTAAYAIHTLAR